MADILTRILATKQEEVAAGTVAYELLTAIVPRVRVEVV